MMSLSHWIKPQPAKRNHLDDSSESEDKDQENEQDDLENKTTKNESSVCDASQSSVKWKELQWIK